MYRENPKIGNYPTHACPYVKQYTLAGYGSFLFSGFPCNRSTEKTQYRENPKIGNYPTHACPYVKQYTLAGYGSFLFSVILCINTRKISFK